MDAEKKKKLEERGWKVASTEEFLELSPEESAYIELKLTLSDHLKRLRKHKKMTQTQLAKLLNSSQSRVAKMEAADPNVSLDLLFRAFFALGESIPDPAKIFELPQTVESH